MKFFFLLISLLNLGRIAFSQEVFSPVGGDTVLNGIHYSFTFGEPIIETGYLLQNSVTQGFHQPLECPVLPQVSGGNDTTICAGSGVVLLGSGADLYTWQSGITNGIEFFPDSSQSYIVEGIDDRGCKASDTVFIEVSTILDIQAGGDTTVCEGDTVILTATGAPNLSWSQGVNNGVPFVPSSTETYIVIGSSGNNCDGSDTVIITVNEVPIISSNVTDVSTSFDGSIDIDVSGGNPPYAFDWDNDGLGDLDDSEDIVFLDTGSYMVTVYDNNGCEVLAQFTVSKDVDGGYDQTIVITPNGDGQNETVDFEWLDNYPNSEVLILNRWGQAIYSSDGPSASWDGTYEDKLLPTADYYFIIDLGDGSAPQTGTITLKY